MPFDPTPFATSAPMGVLLALGLFVIAFTLQLFALRRLAPQRLVGDEAEYLRIANGGPRSTVWVRVPLGAALLRPFRHWAAADQIGAARLANSAVSSLSVGLAAWCAFQAGGLAAGVLAGALLLISVERCILAIHLWPDILLGLWLLLFSQAMRDPGSLPDMAVLGVIAALGFLTRVDFLALAVVAVLLAALQDTAFWPSLCLVAGPTAAAVVGLSLWNGKRHGIWAPDTTARFNLAVAATEATHPQLTTAALMQKTLAAARGGTGGGTPPDQPVEGLLRVAVGSLGLARRRLATLTGPETFVRQSLMSGNRAGYGPSHRVHIGGVIGLNLTGWSSCLLLAYLLTFHQHPPMLNLLIIVVVAVQSAVQTRSRYRMSLLPVLSTNVAVAICSGGAALPSWPGLMLALLFLGLLATTQPRAEVTT
ncbi:hypothetical protein [uncultured Litoreibacter sp.]|uniref:hypothetical protein n=1 Tax=uncultured Litoreibacter sp. TaxID=1392394 RepID=UPI002623EC2B|nr:hypothetical protein [uncultured Litoreibacter sp.]